MRTSARPQLLVVCLALLCSLTMTRSARAQAPKLRAAYTAFASTFTILWVGKDSGLYQKYGADMDLLYIGSSTKSVQALLGGDIDIVYSAAGAVVDANLAGADLVMVGCQYDTGQTSFFTTSPIASIGDLKGKWAHVDFRIPRGNRRGREKTRAGKNVRQLFAPRNPKRNGQVMLTIVKNLP